MKCRELKVGMRFCCPHYIYPYNQLLEVVNVEIKPDGTDEPDLLVTFKCLDDGKEEAHEYTYNQNFKHFLCETNEERREAVLKATLPIFQRKFKELIGEQFEQASRLGKEGEEQDWFLEKFKKAAKEIIAEL